MFNINVKTKDYSYPIIIEDSFNDLSKEFTKQVNSKKLLIVTDTNVEKLYLQEVKGILEKGNIEVYHHIIPAGEVSKNIDTIIRIYEKCLQYGLDRQSCIAALGGGVVGDIAGFTAATFMRGIRFVQIPTTLLAQVDSSVGGKTGVDFEGYKNIIGAFYQPLLIYINISTLKTLPKRELIAGMAEVIKYGIISDATFFEFLDINKKKILDLNTVCLKKIIERCCQIKADIVSEDEKESGIRAILNFGHTIGHAIESASKFELLHGECVGIGMISAAKVSTEIGLMHESEMVKVIELIDKFGLNINANVSLQEVMENIQKDKKISDGSVNMILVKKIGEVQIYKNIDKNTISNNIKSLLT